MLRPCYTWTHITVAKTSALLKYTSESIHRLHSYFCELNRDDSLELPSEESLRLTVFVPSACLKDKWPQDGSSLAEHPLRLWAIRRAIAIAVSELSLKKKLPILVFSQKVFGELEV